MLVLGDAAVLRGGKPMKDDSFSDSKPQRALIHEEAVEELLSSDRRDCAPLEENRDTDKRDLPCGTWDSPELWDDIPLLERDRNREERSSYPLLVRCSPDGSRDIESPADQRRPRSTPSNPTTFAHSGVGASAMDLTIARVTGSWTASAEWLARSLSCAAARSHAVRIAPLPLISTAPLSSIF